MTIQAEIQSSQILPVRWNPLKYHPEQSRYWKSRARFQVVAAGRRSGKTEIAKRKTVYAALSATRFPDCRFGLFAPTFGQAKRIFWKHLKQLVPYEAMLEEPSESELKVTLTNGAEIIVAGLDVPQRFEGIPFDGVVMDEVPDMDKDAWGESLRPCLADRQGWGILLGVPEKGWFEELYTQAQSLPDWEAFHWKSSDILPASEIEALRRELDDLTFRQEFGAEWVEFKGRAYHGYNSIESACNEIYDPSKDLILCFDFNVAPGVCAIVQEFTRSEVGTVACVIDEIWIGNDSNTELVCRQIINRYQSHSRGILCYGDATGGSRGSAKLQGSDWEIIWNVLKSFYLQSSQVKIMRGKDNPRERNRINATNSRLKSFDGRRRLFVNQKKAPKTHEDFLGVRLKEDGSGELDKKFDPMKTHLSDGIGYMVYERYGVAATNKMARSEI